MRAPEQSQLTPDQASQLSADQVSEIAAHAEMSQLGVIDQVSQFYAQHASLIRILGGAIDDGPDQDERQTRHAVDRFALASLRKLAASMMAMSMFALPRCSRLHKVVHQYQ